MPKARLEVLRVATPEPFRVLEPSTVAPFMKVTEPVGVTEPPATAAVKVTEDPGWDGLPLEVRVTPTPCCTDCVRAADVLAR